MSKIKPKNPKKITTGVSEPPVDPNMKRRVLALKKLQIERLKLNGQLAQEVFELKAKGQDLISKYNKMQKQIIAGEVEPEDEDCVLGFEDLNNWCPNIPPNTPVSQVRGVPGFWLKAMQSVDQLKYEWMTPEDEKILLNLMDIELTFSSNRPQISLNFWFAPNDYFENSVLTKTYDIEFGPNVHRKSWDLQQYHPISSKGSRIVWKAGKDVTQKIHKNKKTGAERVVHVNSFFDFFDDMPAQSVNNDGKNDHKYYLYYECEWRLGELLIERFVPNAVLYYTGNAFEDESHTSHSESSDSLYSDSTQESDKLIQESD